MELLLYGLAIMVVAIAPYLICFFTYRMLRKLGVRLFPILCVLWPCGLLASYLILQKSFEVLREAWFFWMFLGLPIQATGLIGILLLPLKERVSKMEPPSAGGKRWLYKGFLNRWSLKERLILGAVAFAIFLLIEVFRLSAFKYSCQNCKT